MSDPSEDGAIARLYEGPLEDFVRRRDALAKELRAAGKREAVAAVKALRKPSRTAWALNRAAARDENVRRLDAAAAGMLEAQTAGGDVRAAMARLRQSVREFAEHAAQAAERAGLGLEPGSLANAVLAVLGNGESRAALRLGRLVEVPEAGGLDFLAALPSTLPVPESPRAGPDESVSQTPEPVASRTAAVLAEARARSERAHAALREAESRLASAEDGLREAEAAVRAARRARERARREMESAAAELGRVERRAAAPAKRRGK